MNKWSKTEIQGQLPMRIGLAPNGDAERSGTKFRRREDRSGGRSLKNPLREMMDMTFPS